MLPLYRQLPYAIALVDYNQYILPAYGIAMLLLGGLILHTWMAAHRATRALRRTKP